MQHESVSATVSFFLFLIFSPSTWCIPAVLCEHGSWMYMTVPSLLLNELLLFVPRVSLSFDLRLVRDRLIDSYFLFPVAKLGPESVIASLVPGCSTFCWPGHLLSKFKSRASVDSMYVDIESWSGLDWKGLLKIMYSNPCAMCRYIFN